MIEKIIKPETELEKQILADKDFIAGANWGKPRRGHPEGQVISHIAEVLANVDKYSTTKNREKLRLIAIIHDSFKYKVDRDKPKVGENHHGMLARRFAEKYITDSKVLDIIELHDEAYNAWCKGDRDGKWEKAEERAYALIDQLDLSLDLFLTFYRCDNETGDKENHDFEWFNELCINS
jgi:hypothetical protein